MKRNILLDPDLISDISDKAIGIRLLTGYPSSHILKRVLTEHGNQGAP